MRLLMKKGQSFRYDGGVSTYSGTSPMTSEPIIIRKSPVFFTFKLLALVILLSCLYSVFVYGTEIDTTLNATFPFFQTFQVGFVVFFSIVLIEVSYGLLLLLYWTHDKYEIHFDEVIHSFGLFTIQKKRYALKNIEHIFCKQTLFGRMFGYGSVELRGQYLKDIITISGISDAVSHADSVKSATILSSTVENVQPARVGFFDEKATAEGV